MYNINNNDADLEKHIDDNKLSMLADFEKNHQIQEQTLEAIVNGIKHAEGNGFQDSKLIWNVAGFVNIISYDLNIIARDLIFSRHEWQKRVYARQACLIIYESINDLFVLLGKDFIELTKNRLNITEFQDNLKEIRKKLNQFKDTYFDDLQSIRNVATAHRDNNVLKQIAIIHQINWSVSLNITKEFNNIINSLSRIIMNILKKGLAELPELKTPDK